MLPSTEMLANIKEASQTVISTRRPWRVFLDLFALTLPSSISEATTRLAHNVTYFLFNYALILLLIFLLTLFRHPLPLLIFLLLSAAWYFLYFSRDDLPLAILPLAFLTVVALFVTAAWLNLLLALLSEAVVVFLHGVLRSTEDLVGDDQDSPYGNMLLGDTPASGAYVPV
ncbi:PRA1 family protein D-like [Vigna radiata var. radiata]|uniref:PRA1 family protein n=1 Tax=Vigna radiata var. radiata TaxID=3916 RepID=A0A1S3V3U4_VIGRR|nr:PRA1 family protein D-like [Vigna radiata var. radiata]